MTANKLVDSRDVQFVLFEMLEINKLLKFEQFSEFDLETFQATIDLAKQISIEKIYDANIAGDQEDCSFHAEKGEVNVPPSYQEAWKTYVEAGFTGLAATPEYGGMGMPDVVWKACLEYLQAGSVPLTMFHTLTLGASLLIKKFGTKELHETYLPKMIDGTWGGTMCLTENVAGSDVGALKSKAIRQDDGTYRITGQKIFISAGEHDLAENIVHTVLARVEGDPEGTKGISIFVVPKFIPNPDGSLGKRNDLICTGIEHKMGLKGSPTCSLSFGDNGECVGYLLGEEKQGMSIMFEMMNAARLDVAVQGQSTASAAYMHAVSYAKSRIQGYDLADRGSGSVPITRHADVRRMLLWMKTYCEAMRALTNYTALQLDISEVAKGEEQQKAKALLDFLIPICKAGHTDNSWLITAEAIQVHGGYGYCSEYPVEQMARDSKIFSLYEGTNGIQSLDLTMRKLLMNKGQANYKFFKAEVNQVLSKYSKEIGGQSHDRLNNSLEKMDRVVQHLGGLLKEGKTHQVLANAVPLQKALKYLSYAWMHAWSLGLVTPKVKDLVGDLTGPDLQKKLESSTEAAYYYGRQASARFYLESEFYQFDAHADYILANETVVAEACDAMFTGAP